jgi:DNA-binding MarR family transcriptional regulator
MHPLSFLHKRVHLCAVATGRKMFARVADMTPARFDLMHLVYENFRRYRNIAPTWQTELRRLLGLRRQTVSKLVLRLVELGWLLRVPYRVAGRRRITIQLTDEGLARIRQAYRAAFMETPLPIGETAQTARRSSARTSRTKARVRAPTKAGREVAKVFEALAWRAAGCRRRGRRFRFLEKLDQMIQDAKRIAFDFGDTSEMIYAFRYESDH